MSHMISGAFHLELPPTPGGGGHPHTSCMVQPEGGVLRAAKFERISSAVSERALTMPNTAMSAARPVGPTVVAFDFALQLWDALRDAVRAVLTRRG